MEVYYVNIYFEDQLDAWASTGNTLGLGHARLIHAARLNKRFAIGLARLNSSCFFYVPGWRFVSVKGHQPPPNVGGLSQLRTWLMAQVQPAGPPRGGCFRAWAPNPVYRRFINRAKKLTSAMGSAFSSEPSFTWEKLAHINSKIELQQAWQQYLLSQRSSEGQPSSTGENSFSMWEALNDQWTGLQKSTSQLRIKREFGQSGRYHRTVETAPGYRPKLPGLRYTPSQNNVMSFSDGRRRLLTEPEVHIVFEFACQYFVDIDIEDYDPSEIPKSRVAQLPGFSVRTIGHSNQTLWLNMPNRTPAHTVLALQTLYRAGVLGTLQNLNIIDDLWALVAQQIALFGENHFLQFALAHSNGYNGYCAVDSFIYCQEGQLRSRGIGEMNYRRTLGNLAYQFGQPNRIGEIEYRALPKLIG